MDELNPSTNGTQELEAQGLGEQALSELPTGEVVNQQVQEEDFSLPESSNDRTKEQFNKLLQRNKELNEKLKNLETGKKLEPEVPAYTSVYETIKSDPYGNVTQQESDYIDEDGTVDIEKLNRDLKALKVSALEARRLAEQAREDVEVREAHMKHPYLDPQNPEFDSQFFELVRDRVVRQKFYEGKNSSLKSVADQVISFYKPKNLVQQEKEQVAAEFKKSQQNIVNNAPISSSTGRRQEVSNNNELREKTRLGDKEALLERLRRL
jgi:hypothetical protein